MNLYLQALKSIVFYILIGALLASCTKVRFNERERLSQSDMVFDSNPLQSKLENHVYNSREGATGAFSSGGGGGCGCY